jgi:type IV pilus assembly protein PilX
MLKTTPSKRRARRPAPARQRGIVLFFALIVMVAMVLAGIALIRSASTGNRVAGNLAFQQSATQSADVGVEAAIAWLQANNTGSTLYSNSADATQGYFAARGTDPDANTSWESYWNTTVVGTGRYHTMAQDAAGNVVSYAIHRLCNGIGDPNAGAACSVAPAVVGSEGNSKGSGVLPVTLPNQQYYRITARVAGPRNTVSFVQVVVAM